MIQIERHIETLLLDNDCVIVPAFGGFMAHYVSARYEASEGLFLPPLRTLGFNPQLRINDSLLAQSYIEAYDISYPEALKRISSEVEELKNQIAEYGRYELNDLGTISINADGRYEFQPCEAGILTPQLYALNSFEMPLLPARESADGSLNSESETDEAAHSSKVVAMKPHASASDADANGYSGEKTITIKLSTIRNAAAACFAAAALMLFPPQISDEGKQPVANTQFKTEVLQRIMPKEITTGKPDLSVAVAKAEGLNDGANKDAKENLKGKENAKESGETAENQTDIQRKPCYVIVLACQVSEKNANRFVEQLHARGLADARVARTGKDTRVIYGAYGSEQEAYNALRPLRKSDSDFAEGWVMKSAE